MYSGRFHHIQNVVIYHQRKYLLQLTSSNNINIDPELNMRIVAICVCYNEEKLLPFFLDYYTSFCDEIVFFDGNLKINTTTGMQADSHYHGILSQLSGNE